MSNALKISKIGLAGLFLVCLLDMPYGYYQLIRFLGMVVFFVLAYNAYKNNSNLFLIIWLASGVLINPLMKIALGRELWNIVDVIWAVILISSLWIEKDKEIDSIKVANGKEKRKTRVE